MSDPDPLDQQIKLWTAAMPDVDTRGLALLGRTRRIALRARLAIEAIYARHGIDAGGFDVLAALRRAPEPHRMRPTDLYRALMISSGGLTAKLNKLEAARLIHRQAANEDRRSLSVELTPRGKEVAEAAFREEMELEARMIAGLTEKEQWVLEALLKKLEATLDGA